MSLEAWQIILTSTGWFDRVGFLLLSILSRGIFGVGRNDALTLNLAKFGRNAPDLAARILLSAGFQVRERLHVMLDSEMLVTVR